jgi:hypothetical protein
MIYLVTFKKKGLKTTSHEHERGAVRRDVAFVRQRTIGKGDQLQPCSADLGVEKLKLANVSI